MILIPRQGLWLLAMMMPSLISLTATAFVVTRTPTMIHRSTTCTTTSFHTGQERMCCMAVNQRSTKRSASLVDEKSSGSRYSDLSLGLLQTLARAWQDKITTPPHASIAENPKHDHNLHPLSTQVAGLQKEREEQATKSKQQLSETERRLQALQEEYSVYRREMTRRLEQQAEYAIEIGALQEDYNHQILDLQEQLIHQVETGQKKAAKAARLDRELNEERRTVERLRHLIHDSRSKSDERLQELENKIAQLEQQRIATLVTRREKQLATMQASSQSLRTLLDKMRQLVVQRTRHRLEAIQTRLLHPLARRSMATRENTVSILSRIKMMVQNRRRHRRANGSSSSSSRGDQTSRSLSRIVISNSKDNRSGRRNGPSKSLAHSSRSAVALTDQQKVKV
jgi:hypothetical protein